MKSTRAFGAANERVRMILAEYLLSSSLRLPSKNESSAEVTELTQDDRQVVRSDQHERGILAEQACTGSRIVALSGPTSNCVSPGQ